MLQTGRDTLDTTTTRETTDSRLGYTLDIITKNLPVSLGSTFSEALSTLATCETRQLSRKMSQSHEMVLRPVILTEDE